MKGFRKKRIYDDSDSTGDSICDEDSGEDSNMGTETVTKTDKHGDGDPGRKVDRIDRLVLR